MNEVNLSTPRSLGQIFDLVVVSHLRRPVLFLTMALSVVAPYTLIVLAATGATPLGESHVRAETILLIDIVSFALVGPLVSVLHVHALALIGEGTRPSFAAVYRPALKVLPVAAAAQIVAGIGIGAGIVVFIIPGLILAVRLAVVAQVAAMQRTDWMGALRGSFELTRSNGWHVFGALLVAGVFEFALAAAAEAVAGSHTHVQQVVLAIVVGTIGQSFTAMTAAVLYFDLRAR
ncbi:MAG TPA: hypothetical protein VG223_12730 [Solirubrobacteraceae bacterium]|jgi:hypothetical protein|nr:hypothetical protein [Solirubrobacteraceae bacterium]